MITVFHVNSQVLFLCTTVSSFLSYNVQFVALKCAVKGSILPPLSVADRFADGIGVQQISLESKTRADGNEGAGLAAKDMKTMEGEGEDPASWSIRESAEQRHHLWPDGHQL